MTDSWTQLEGHLVDEKFPLRRYLGGSDHSIVFLTHRPDDSMQDAAIKLIPADSIVPDLQFSRWRLAAQLSHPHLLRQFATGGCQLDGRDWLYIVTEYAEENLAQILPERALTEKELGDALEPMLAALVYLHSRDFVHARIKPPNILVAGDQVKLSTDGVLQLGDSPGRPQFPSAYDAPEYASGSLSAASDSWSLGMAVVEALTQSLPAAPAEQDTEAPVPSTLPASFLAIARHTLQRDPEKRWTVAEIAARLKPQLSASGKAIAPPAMSQPAHTAYISRLGQTQSWRLPPSPAARKYPSAKPSYFWLGAIAVMVLLAVLAIPRLANRNAHNSASTSAAPAVAIPQPVAPARSSRAQSAVPRTRPKSPEKMPPVEAQQQSRPQDSLKTASEKEKIPAASAASPSAGSSTRGAKGAVLGQVLPEVSQKARATIRGTVRVNVRVQVSPAGKVTQAERDSGSSSPYFTDLSLEAARRWAFRPTEVAGRSAPAEWLIRFEFSPSDTKAFPEQANP